MCRHDQCYTAVRICTTLCFAHGMEVSNNSISSCPSSSMDARMILDLVSLHQLHCTLYAALDADCVILAKVSSTHVSQHEIVVKLYQEVASYCKISIVGFKSTKEGLCFHAVPILQHTSHGLKSALKCGDVMCCTIAILHTTTSEHTVCMAQVDLGSAWQT